ncbi:MAG: hypothetical protein MJ094_04195 [Saccharofermentans sp.]|nr:hypothetical protein [Saccharofermentans sp.]
MRVTFNDNYKLVRSMWIDKKLSSMPDIRLGKHYGVDIAREYGVSKNGHRTHHMYTPKNADYLEAISTARLRESLMQERESLPNSRIKISCIGVFKMTDEKWNSLPQSANPLPIRTKYVHNGIRMRSRFEMLVAEVIDELNLQFKYEIAITLGGDIVYPDFTVYLPELGMCFIIECLGKVDDPDYVITNTRKLIDYYKAGFVPDIDLLVFCGQKESLPDTLFIRNQIVRMINGIMDESIIFQH